VNALPHKVSKVTVGKAVDGTKKRKPRSDKGRPRAKQNPVDHLVVDPRVMAAAAEAIRPGQRLVIADAECVRLVNI